MNAQIFSKTLLKWFDKHGRKHLPWQKNKTAYRVWVSEIMLQQTQVNTVIPYYEKFMKHFPTIVHLAHAPQDEVLHLWTGLGYYSRARNLHRTAKIITENFNTQFPKEMTELQALPGIGRSTAGAIAAIALQQRATILDGNVKRVLARFHAIKEWPGLPKVTDTLWSIAERYTPVKRIADYTQAIMDLGATICTRSQPRCDSCPLQKKCQAFALNLQTQLPRAKPRKTLPTRETRFLILQQANGKILLEQRPAPGIWGNLWSFPEMTDEVSLAALKKYCRQSFGCEVSQAKTQPTLRHTFSHFHLQITPIILSAKPLRKTMATQKQVWYHHANSEKIGLPAPVKKILEKLS